MYSVVCQEWEELWEGKQVRPNGISLHKDRPALRRYLDAYWKTAEGRDAPRPTGSGETLLVDEKTWATVQENSMRIYSIYSGKAFSRRVLNKPKVEEEPDER